VLVSNAFGFVFAFVLALRRLIGDSIYAVRRF
jgi:hypothetical protein